MLERKSIQLGNNREVSLNQVVKKGLFEQGLFEVKRMRMNSTSKELKKVFQAEGRVSTRTLCGKGFRGLRNRKRDTVPGAGV